MVLDGVVEFVVEFAAKLPDGELVLRGVDRLVVVVFAAKELVLRGVDRLVDVTFAAKVLVDELLEAGEPVRGGRRVPPDPMPKA